MKCRNFKLFLVVGLVCVAGLPWITEHLLRIEASDFVSGLIKGCGIGLILVIVVLQKRSNSCNL